MIKQWVLNTIIRWKTMGRSRKYQLSISLSSDLIDLIEKAVDESDYHSRSAFLEDLIRENIDEKCLRCEISDKLVKHHLRMELPPTMDDALKLIDDHKNRVPGSKGSLREAEKLILSIVTTLQNDTGTFASLIDVLAIAKKSELSRAKTEDLIDKLCRDGRLMRPSGYDTLQVV